MMKRFSGGAYLVRGREIVANTKDAPAQLTALGVNAIEKEAAAKQTIAYGILQSHNTSGNMQRLKIKFDALASHDITYVGIIQTARASGLRSFPLPYVLTNCHNSLCAVGGTINEDDHTFGLSAAQKYGGIYVPAHQAVIHQYMREMMSGCGRMILGSDSHTRYGALGTMAIGEGGPELVKQLLEKTYDVNLPEVVGVYLTGKPAPGVGPQDIALAIIKEVFADGFVKNKVMEFVGDGIANINVEYRNGIDVMTTETTCLSSIWETDGQTREYFRVHGREEAYAELRAGEVAYYDAMLHVDMSQIRPMIALPFHPSNAYEIETFNQNAADILRKVEKDAAEQIDNPAIEYKLTNKLENGRLRVDQGVIAGCAGGTYDNIVDAADIIRGHSLGSGEFALSVYPASQPVFLSLVENGRAADLMLSGATMRTAFCGPCFGAGDVPSNGALSIRHTTRNFPSREGSRPGDGQIASVALMDARSIAATAINGGLLTPATELDITYTKPEYRFNGEVYKNRVYYGVGKPTAQSELKYGPNITDWPQMSPMTENLLLKVASVILDPVTTTDELIPSGETSSYRSNPEKLAEFTLSRKDPAYVGRAKQVRELERARLAGENPFEGAELAALRGQIEKLGYEITPESTGIGSVIYARKPGDGSAREQAASCQKVLGGWANIAAEYATKRYRSNLINWGMLPFVMEGEPPFGLEDTLFIPGIRRAVEEALPQVDAFVLTKDGALPLTLKLAEMTEDERGIILAGCLINSYRG